jgi:transcriptional regulator with XRE-family HTH domain
MKETLGQKIARLRREKNYTQEDLAKKFNVSTQAVSKWENDLSAPDISILKDLAKTLGVTIDYLLSNETEEVVNILPKENRKPINKMVLKIKISSTNGDKVSVNLPMPFIFACINSGVKLPSLNGSDTLNSIDFKEIINLVEQGVVGELVSIDSADGDTIKIFVE